MLSAMCCHHQIEHCNRRRRGWNGPHYTSSLSSLSSEEWMKMIIQYCQFARQKITSTMACWRYGYAICSAFSFSQSFILEVFTSVVFSDAAERRLLAQVSKQGTRRSLKASLFVCPNRTCCEISPSRCVSHLERCNVTLITCKMYSLFKISTVSFSCRKCSLIHQRTGCVD